MSTSPDAILEHRGIVGHANELIEDVPEPMGHLLIDQAKLPARQSADDVSLRDDD